MQLMIEVSIREQAVQLRREGYLYGQIARSLRVAKSTAYLWTKDVHLGPEEKVKISAALGDARRRAVAGTALAKAKKSALEEEAIVSEAEEIIGALKLDVNYQRVLCATMFWCEGEKDTRSGVRFINSDPAMVRSFLTLLRDGFLIDESRFHALLHLHEYHNEQEQIEFWSEATGIPSERFYKSYIKPHTGKNFHDGYPGCLSLRYGDVRLAKLLKMIYSSLGNSLGA